MKTIVVTATRTEKNLFDVPNTVQVLTSRELHTENLIRTVPESLREVPGVMVQKTGHGQGSPYIRGFTGYQTLFLIDGIRLNNSTFRIGPNQYWNTVDPMTVERMEIVKGPGSVLYGSDAIGGTVNAITRSRQELLGGSQWERRLYYRFATAEDGNVLRAETSAELGPVEFLVGGTRKDFGDLVGGQDVGRQPKTGYKEWDGDVKACWHLDPNQDLVFAHQHVFQDDAWRAHKTEYGISWEDTTNGSDKKRALDQRRDLTYIQYHVRELGTFIERLKVSASYHSQAEERFRRRNDNRVNKYGVEVGTMGLWFQAESPSPIGHWTYGAEFYRDYVESWARNYNADGSFAGEDIQGPVGDNATYDTVGLFVQNQFTLFEKLDLTLGVRYNHAAADVGQYEDTTTGNTESLSEDWDSVVGSARFVWRIDPQEHWAAYVGVSQGFRAPNLSDLTRLDNCRSTEIETPSPDLDPEEYISFEIGLRSRFENWSAQAAYFYTDIEDMIVRTPTGNVIGGDDEVTKTNAGDGYVQGIELGTSYRFLPEWTVFATLAWLDGEVDTYPTSAPEEETEPIDRLMPTTGLLGIRWDHPDRKYWAEAVMIAADEADDLSTRDERDTDRIPPDGTPEYLVLTVRGGWKLTDTLTLSAAVENLTNEDYRIHGSGQNEPGSNVVFGVDWKF
jgi:hemoglobin/transferrin/lactoferrin receptor protein